MFEIKYYEVEGLPYLVTEYDLHTDGRFYFESGDKVPAIQVPQDEVIRVNGRYFRKSNV